MKSPVLKILDFSSSGLALLSGAAKKHEEEYFEHILKKVQNEEKINFMEKFLQISGEKKFKKKNIEKKN